MRLTWHVIPEKGGFSAVLSSIRAVDAVSDQAVDRELEQLCPACPLVGAAAIAAVEGFSRWLWDRESEDYARGALAVRALSVFLDALRPAFVASTGRSHKIARERWVTAYARITLTRRGQERTMPSGQGDPDAVLKFLAGTHRGEVPMY